MTTDYKDILMNECGDIAIVNGDLALVDKADAIRQVWLIHIRTFLGEWFLNLNIGVPYIQKVFAKLLTRAEVQRVFNEASLAVPGIKRVDNVDVGDIDLTTRRVAVTVEAVCDNVEGSVTFSYKGALPPEDCAILGSSNYPVTLGDALIWFDAQDEVKTVYNPSGPSILAQNKAGAGQAAGEGAASNLPEIVQVSPLNNKRAIYFHNPVGGGNDEFMRFLGTPALRSPLSGDFSVFVVCKPVDAGGAPNTRGLLSFAGFETVNYNRESYDFYLKQPASNGAIIFKPSVQSVLADGSMERASVLDWTSYSGATITKETSAPRRGSMFLRAAEFTGPGAARQTVLSVDTFYRARGYYRGDGSIAPRVRIVPFIIATGTSSTSWQKFDAAEVAALEGGSNFDLVVEGPGHSDFDIVSVQPLVLKDGNMEYSSAGYWAAWVACSVTKSTSSPYQGLRVLRVDSSSGEDSAYQSTLTVGKTYRVTGVARRVSGSVVPGVSNDGAAWFWTGDASTSWQPIDAVFTATTTRLHLMVSDTGVVDFDDLEVEEVKAEAVTPASFYDSTVLSFVCNQSANLMRMYRDGAQLGAAKSAALRQLDGEGLIGALLDQADFWEAENFFHGYIGEILVYSKALTDPDLTSLHNFLLNKWNF